jgi:hypothetical protein
MLRPLFLAAALLTCVQLPAAEAQPKTWTQVGMLTCRLNPASFRHFRPSIDGMQVRFKPAHCRPQRYEGALNTVGIDLGVTAGGVMGWAVLSPTAGPPPGALAGEYVGASADVGLGLGAGVNVLVGGSGRSFALQPVSVRRLCCPERYVVSFRTSAACRQLNLAVIERGGSERGHPIAVICPGLKFTDRAIARLADGLCRPKNFCANRIWHAWRQRVCLVAAESVPAGTSVDWSTVMKERVRSSNRPASPVGDFPLTS